MVWSKLAFIAPLLLGTTIGILPSAAHSATITVTTTLQNPGNSSDCTLGEAILAANTNSAVDGCSAGSGSGTDDIELQAGETYNLTVPDPSGTGEGLPPFQSNIALHGNGATIARIGGDSPPFFRLISIFSASAVAVSIDSLTLKGGQPEPIGNIGGAIFLDSFHQLTLRDVTFEDNQSSQQGGALNSHGNLIVERCAFVDNSVVSSESDGDGGAIFITFGSAEITNSTFSNNRASGAGGAIGSQSDLILSNVTITGNTSDFDGTGDRHGGGIANFDDGTLTIRNSIVSDNIDSNPNDPNTDCFNDAAEGEFNSQGFNLIGDPSGCDALAADSSNLIGLKATLLPLSETGNLTPIHPLAAGSFAINAGNPDGCTQSDGSTPLVEDQKLELRPIGSRCDIGATESNCGNGSTEDDEECDDGNDVNDDACNNRCLIPGCGDDELQAGEECDDGGTTAGDGCDASCQLEETPPPNDNDGEELGGGGCSLHPGHGARALSGIWSLLFAPAAGLLKLRRS